MTATLVDIRHIVYLVAIHVYLLHKHFLCEKRLYIDCADMTIQLHILTFLNAYFIELPVINIGALLIIV